jgi:hypothetical protein
MQMRFRYNPASCRFEPVHRTPAQRMKGTAFTLLLSALFGFAAFHRYAQHSGYPAEQELAAENRFYKAQWNHLHRELTKTGQQLAALLERDNTNYRMMLDLPPLSPDQLQAGSGGAPVPVPADAQAYGELREGYHHLVQFQHRLGVALQSLSELHREADRKSRMKESRPAIQPVDNRELNRLHTTFGLRMHPIFGVLMEHKGLDFALPKGSPVYATGNGRVSQAHYSPSYGNVVYIDHGFGYETRYAHLQKFIVHPGQYVKRGQVIGYVGNTGISVSPHLHYEVYYKGTAVNPIHFFQRDLSEEEYLKLIRSAGKAEHSLD